MKTMMTKMMKIINMKMIARKVKIMTRTIVKKMTMKKRMMMMMKKMKKTMKLIEY